LLFTIFVIPMKFIIILVSLILTVDGICETLSVEDIIELLFVMDNPMDKNKETQQLFEQCDTNLT